MGRSTALLYTPMKPHLPVLLLLSLLSGPAWAEVVEYRLEITFETMNISGSPARAMLINGSYPAPVLRFREGDTARIHVTNSTDEDTSVHWHGLLVPPSQDGVPYVSSPPITPGTTFTYEFPCARRVPTGTTRTPTCRSSPGFMAASSSNRAPQAHRSCARPWSSCRTGPTRIRSRSCTT